MIYKKGEVLSGYNFARSCDHVFAENLITADNRPAPTVTGIDIINLEPENIIFCKTDYIRHLFDEIKILPEWYRLKIITHESDYDINESIFKLKPKCIEKWLAINVTYFHEDLIPIPLGIGNDHSSTTLKIENLNAKDVCQKENLLYINHRNETAPQHRAWIYKWFEDKSWCTLKQPSLSLPDFKKDLDRHHFMLCPRGNGIDTHRLWECLYSGVIPVVERHITHNNITDLPILFVDNFKDITEDMLIANLHLLKNKNLNKLSVYFWKNLIKEGKI